MIWRGVRVGAGGIIEVWITVVRDRVNAAEMGPACRGVPDQRTWDLLLALRAAHVPMRVEAETGRIIARVDAETLRRQDVRLALEAAMHPDLVDAVALAALHAHGPTDVLAGYAEDRPVTQPAARGKPETVWLTVDEMAVHCPPCAERMQFFNIRKVRALRDPETGEVTGYAEGFRQALVDPTRN